MIIFVLKQRIFDGNYVLQQECFVASANHLFIREHLRNFNLGLENPILEEELGDQQQKWGRRAHVILGGNDHAVSAKMIFARGQTTNSTNEGLKF